MRASGRPMIISQPREWQKSVFLFSLHHSLGAGKGEGVADTFEFAIHQRGAERNEQSKITSSRRLDSLDRVRRAAAAASIPRGADAFFAPAGANRAQNAPNVHSDHIYIAAGPKCSEKSAESGDISWRVAIGFRFACAENQSAKDNDREFGLQNYEGVYVSLILLVTCYTIRSFDLFLLIQQMSNVDLWISS